MGTEYFLIDLLGRSVLSLNKWDYFGRVEGVTALSYPSEVKAHTGEGITFATFRAALVLAVEDGPLYDGCKERAITFIRDAEGPVLLAKDGGGIEELWEEDRELTKAITLRDGWTWAVWSDEPPQRARPPRRVRRRRGPKRRVSCSTCGVRASLARGDKPACHACVAVLDLRAYLAVAVDALDGEPLDLPPLVTVRSLLEAVARDDDGDDGDDVIDAEFPNEHSHLPG